MGPIVPSSSYIQLQGGDADISIEEELDHCMGDDPGLPTDVVLQRL
jgi:hypothetical protein